MRVALFSTRPLFSVRRPPEGVITRLAPSEHVPGCQGVYLTTAVKKFTPIEILPSAVSASTTTSGTRPLSSSSSVHATTSSTSHTPTGSAPVPAPPFVCNLACAPQRTISLRRFLALRHSFSHDTFLNVATEGGWYLLVPSSAVPLADPEGLARWQQRHHPRYRAATDAVDGDKGQGEAASAGKEVQRMAFRRRAYEDLAKLDAEELSEEELLAVGKAIADEKAAIAAKDAEDEAESAHDANEDDADEDEEASDDGTADPTAVAAVSTPPSASRPPPRRHRHHGRVTTRPPLVPEAHLFQLNDAIYWPLPPSEDVSEPSYWANHRLRMRLYQDTDSIRPEDHEQFLADALAGKLRTPPAQASQADKAAFQDANAAPLTTDASTTLTQQEVYAMSEALYRTATRKANAAVQIDDTTGLVTLVPLLDLEADTELVLHYGREWWLQRLLSMVLLAVPDTAMAQIRWIEGVCSGGGGGGAAEVEGEAGSDAMEPFPQLILARRQPRHARRRHGETPASTGTAAEPADASVAKGKRVLFNVATRDKATEAQMLAFAVRRSCLDRDFYAALLFWSGARRRRSTQEVIAPAQAAVFTLDKPDEEVPLSVLRRALIRSLEEERYVADMDVEDVLEDVAAHADDEEARTDEANKEETFSV